MSELQPHTIPFGLALNQLADDPIIAADIAYRMSRASENDNFDFVRSTELEAELANQGCPENDVKAAMFLGDAEYLLFGLYGAYFVIVMGAAVVVFLEWGQAL